MVPLRSEVPIGLLRPHPKQEEYFSAPSPEEYEALKRSIAAQGIRDPLKVAPDYTVIAGHLRLRIAGELGMERVPVVVVDGDPGYLEYLLIADNDERRTCADPIKKARRAEFLKRYWGVREGSLARPGAPEGHFVPQAKTLADVAEAVGETEKGLKRLLKLNDLIPPLQDLVSQGRLSRTAAYSLAFLPPGEQEGLLAALGESGVCGLSVKQAQELRRALEESRRAAEEARARLAEAERRLAEAERGTVEAERLRREIEALRLENEKLKAGRPEATERIVERVVFRADPALETELRAARAKAEELARELDSVRFHADFLAGQREELLIKISRLEREKEALERRADALQGELARERRLKEAAPAPPLEAEFRRISSLVSELLALLEKALRSPEQVRKYAEQARAAGVVETRDAEKALAKLAADVKIAFGATLLEAGLKLLMIRAGMLLDLLAEGAAGGRPLKVLEGGRKDGREEASRNAGGGLPANA